MSTKYSSSIKLVYPSDSSVNFDISFRHLLIIEFFPRMKNSTNKNQFFLFEWPDLSNSKKCAKLVCDANERRKKKMSPTLHKKKKNMDVIWGNERRLCDVSNVVMLPQLINYLVRLNNSLPFWCLCVCMCMT